MTTFNPLALDGVFEIVPPKFGDARGFFSETYNRSAFTKAGIDLDFVQDNHSYSDPTAAWEKKILLRVKPRISDQPPLKRTIDYAECRARLKPQTG